MNYVKDNRMLSLLGQRGTFGVALCEFAEQNDNIFALSPDLTRVSGLERFAGRYPDRFLNVGIAEQNAVGMAAGLADQGLIPFVTTFANFAALRANEFVRHFMAYMQCNVKLIGLASGFSMEFFGNTHYGLEDIAVLRSMPNITLLSPADCLEVVKCVDFCVNHNGPVYLRLSGNANNPIIHHEDYVFEVGKAEKLRDGEEAIVYSTGSMVNVSLKAASELENRGIKVSVVNIHTIKPFDCDFVIKHKDFKLIVTVEEHSHLGGLGSSVAEILAAHPNHGKLVAMGTIEYEKAGDYNYMLQQHGLTANVIVDTVVDFLSH